QSRPDYLPNSGRIAGQRTFGNARVDCLFEISEQQRSHGLATWSTGNCCRTSRATLTRNSHISFLRVHRRVHFESDAVRFAGDLAQNFRLYSASRTKPAENFPKRARV